MRNAVACVLGLGALALLGQSARAQLLEKKALSLEAARKMVVAAEAEAERNHWRGVIAVVDESGWLILLERHACLRYLLLETGRSSRPAARRLA
jgi:glc operon protein GlcG